jgi:Flp pilus assembly protein TadB
VENCRELWRTCSSGREGSPQRSTNIINNSSNKNSIDKNPVNNGNPNNKKTRKTTRRTTRRPADIPPIRGVSLIIALVTVIVAFVAGADPWLIAALVAVIVALASRIP